MIDLQKFREILKRPDLSDEEATRIRDLYYNLAALGIEGHRYAKWLKEGKKGQKPDLKWF